VLRPTRLALLAAAFASGAAAQDVPVIDSKVWGSGVSLQAPTWVDARQLLFLTGPGFKINEGLRALAIWELDGKPRVYRENINYYCYRGGVLVYKMLDPADKGLVRGTWYSGAIGSERAGRKDAAGDVARLYDPLNCRSGTNQEAAAQTRRTTRRIVPLLEKHGYLDVRPVSGPEAMDNKPVQLVRADNRAVTLPFGSREFASTRVAYYEFSGAYLISSLYFDAKQRQSVSPWPASIERPAWLVSPDGTASRQTIPKGPWSGKDDPFVYLSKAGLVLVRHGGSSERTDGLYLVSDGRTQHLLPGRVGPVGVSPDGCSIAFTHAPSLEADVEDPKENRRTLKAMRLCNP
jgi:hypothetical protein